MLLKKALQNKAVRLLWTGQLLSTIGDELYRIAFIWMSVSLIGNDVSFLTALLSLSAIIMTLFSGKWSDHWNPFKILFYADLSRACIVLIPVILYLFHISSLLIFTCVAVSVSAIGALYDSSFPTVYPIYCEDALSLQAANGLFSTTLRLARVLAPVLIAWICPPLPMIHLFSLDSLSFIFSLIMLLLLFRLPRVAFREMKAPERLGFWKSFSHPFKLMSSNRTLYRCFIIKALAGGLWQMSYGVGFALLVKERFGLDLSVYGTMMGAYGLGNIISAVLSGNWERKNPTLLFNFGIASLGTGFVLSYFSHSVFMLCVSAFLCAIGGPLNDTPFNDLLFQHFKSHELPKLFRLRNSAENGLGLLAFCIAPICFSGMGVPTTILTVGILILMMSGMGFWFTQREKTCHT